MEHPHLGLSGMHIFQHLKRICFFHGYPKLWFVGIAVHKIHDTAVDLIRPRHRNPQAHTVFRLYRKHVFHIFYFIQNGLRPLHKIPSLVSQAHASGGTHEQLHSQLCLHGFDGIAQMRLG